MKHCLGFTLVDVLVGIALLVIVFSGIFGAYQLGLKTLLQSEHRVVATAIANEFLEMARNLPYGEVGVAGSYPDGFFSPSQKLLRNGIEYTVATDIDYVADPADGLAAPQDSCLNDYKRMVVQVSWQKRFSGEVKAAGDIAPQNEVQECEETGGLLRVNVFNALGVAVDNANVVVRDVESSLTDLCVTGPEGTCQVLLPASLPGGGENYKIEITKTGYSKEETLRNGDVYQGTSIVTPKDPHATLFQGEITGRSFAIDQLSNFQIETRSSREKKEFFDPFDDTSLLSNLQNTEVKDGNLQLHDDGGTFPLSGTATSVSISDGAMLSWGELTRARALPAQTSIMLQVFHEQGVNWVLVPDKDLPGNSLGFSASPVDLSGLNVPKYPALRVQANLATSDFTSTPLLQEWKLSYFTQQDFALGNISFHLRGVKSVGEDLQEQPIFKYDADQTTSGIGSLALPSIEWDNYIFSIDQELTGLSIEETVPAPQPISLAPSITQQVTLYLAAENSLLVKMQETGTTTPIFSASVRLFKTGFDKTQLTNEEGQTLFIPLDAGNYNLHASAEGYDDFIGTMFVDGNDSAIVELQLNPD